MLVLYTHPDLIVLVHKFPLFSTKYMIKCFLTILCLYCRILHQGRGFTNRCQNAINSVKSRINETKQNCSIQ